MPTTRTATLNLRITEDERQALDRLAAVTGMPVSAVARAGLRLIVEDPSKLVDMRALTAAGVRTGPPPPPRKRGRRKR